jgi:alpha-tubulin suppressor-like RCC1 family protein
MGVWGDMRLKGGRRLSRSFSVRTAVSKAVFHAVLPLSLLGGCLPQQLKSIPKSSSAIRNFSPLNVADNVAPNPSTGVSRVVAGLQHSCAIRGGALSCWGLNKHGQIGNGESGVFPGKRDSLTGTDYTAKMVLSPLAVPGMSAGVTDVAVGYEHTCAIRDSRLYCWGANINGQLGLGRAQEGEEEVHSSPKLVLSEAKAVAAAGRWTCAIVKDALMCFGSRFKRKGEEVFSPTLISSVPSVMIASKVRSVSLSTNHACAVVGDDLQCFGLNASGEIGNGDQKGKDVESPWSVLKGGVTDVAVTDGRSCALQSGAMRCFGLSFADRAVDEKDGGWREVNRSPYEAVFWKPLLPPNQLTAHGALIGKDGDLYYGSYYHAQGARQKIAVGVEHFDFSETEAGGCMIFRNQRVKCWGSNLFGQLGDGKRAARESVIHQAQDLSFR